MNDSGHSVRLTFGDRYRDFSQLCRHEQEGFDYVILHRTGGSGLLVMAPHGGGIEPGTSDIADAIAGQCHAFYCFKGIKKQGNRVLHITSNRFDEPRAMTMVPAADWVLTVHGCRDAEPVMWVGGLDRRRGDNIIEGLQEAGIPADRCERSGLRGLNPANICNQGRRRAGVQLEISFGLRNRLFADLYQRRIRGRTPLFHRLVATLASCLQEGVVSMETQPGLDPACY